MLDEIRNMLFLMALGKFAIFCLFVIAVYFIFKSDLIKGLNFVSKWEKQQDELHKQKIELLKAQTEALKKQSKDNTN